MVISLCLNCGGAISGGLYCGNRCRAAVRRLRQRLADLPPCIAQLYEAMAEHGPIGATAYRLVRYEEDGARIVYPRADRHAWQSVDNGLVYRRAYLLFPWEIPSVDATAIYGVVFLRRGQVLDTPRALLGGVWLVPVLAMPSPGSRF